MEQKAHRELFRKMEQVMSELLALQEEKLWECGRRIVPYLTKEDLLQPNDFDELEYNPHFRYEEGLLSGLMTARSAFQALEQEGRYPE